MPGNMTNDELKEYQRLLLREMPAARAEAVSRRIAARQNDSGVLRRAWHNFVDSIKISDPQEQAAIDIEKAQNINNQIAQNNAEINDYAKAKQSNTDIPGLTDEQRKEAQSKYEEAVDQVNRLKNENIKLEEYLRNKISPLIADGIDVKTDFDRIQLAKLNARMSRIARIAKEDRDTFRKSIKKVINGETEKEVVPEIEPMITNLNIVEQAEADYAKQYSKSLPTKSVSKYIYETTRDRIANNLVYNAVTTEKANAEQAYNDERTAIISSLNNIGTEYKTQVDLEKMLADKDMLALNTALTILSSSGLVNQANAVKAAIEFLQKGGPKLPLAGYIDTLKDTNPEIYAAYNQNPDNIVSSILYSRLNGTLSDDNMRKLLSKGNNLLNDDQVSMLAFGTYVLGKKMIEDPEFASHINGKSTADILKDKVVDDELTSKLQEALKDYSIPENIVNFYDEKNKTGATSETAKFGYFLNNGLGIYKGSRIKDADNNFYQCLLNPNTLDDRIQEISLIESSLKTRKLELDNDKAKEQTEAKTKDKDAKLIDTGGLLEDDEPIKTDGLLVDEPIKTDGLLVDDEKAKVTIYRNGKAVHKLSMDKGNVDEVVDKYSKDPTALQCYDALKDFENGKLNTSQLIAMTQMNPNFASIIADSFKDKSIFNGITKESQLHELIDSRVIGPKEIDEFVNNFDRTKNNCQLSNGYKKSLTNHAIAISLKDKLLDKNGEVKNANLNDIASQLYDIEKGNTKDAKAVLANINNKKVENFYKNYREERKAQEKLIENTKQDIIKENPSLEALDITNATKEENANLDDTLNKEVSNRIANDQKLDMSGKDLAQQLFDVHSANKEFTKDNAKTEVTNADGVKDIFDNVKKEHEYIESQLKGRDDARKIYQQMLKKEQALEAKVQAKKEEAEAEALKVENNIKLSNISGSLDKNLNDAVANYRDMLASGASKEDIEKAKYQIVIEGGHANLNRNAIKAVIYRAENMPMEIGNKEAEKTEEVKDADKPEIVDDTFIKTEKLQDLFDQKNKLVKDDADRNKGTTDYHPSENKDKIDDIKKQIDATAQELNLSNDDKFAMDWNSSAPQKKREEEELVDVSSPKKMIDGLADLYNSAESKVQQMDLLKEMRTITKNEGISDEELQKIVLDSKAKNSDSKEETTVEKSK